MRSKRVRVMIIIAVVLLIRLTGCGKKNEDMETTAESTEIETEDTTGSKAVTQYEDQKVTVDLGEDNQMSVTYKAEDLDASWDTEEAVYIAFENGTITVDGGGAVVDQTTVTIQTAGTFVVSGTLSDGQILVDAGKEDVVRLVLNGVTLSNSSFAPIYGLQSGKLILTLETGTENTISDAAEYVYETAEEDEPDAAIFSKDDVVINGNGALSVSGNYACGIRSKDDLTVISGTITIAAKSDGLKGKDSVVIRDGDIQIVSGKDGIKSNNDSSPDKGYIWIDGGSIAIAAQDDGIQAETRVVVNGGVIDITECQEGIAGLTVDINGGVIDMIAQDDGINAAATVETEREKMMDQEGVYIRIAGGEIAIDAKGDGIDSNGDLYIEGGTVYVSGSSAGADAVIDYNGKAYLTGGILFAVGNSGMMQTFDQTSTQNYMVVYYDGNKPEETLLTLEDENGIGLAAFTPAKAFNAVIVSSPDLEEGKTYRILADDDIVELTIQGVETVSGSVQAGRGFGGGGDRNRQGQMPENGELPQRQGMDGENGPKGRSELSEDLERGAFELPEGEPPSPPEGGGDGRGELPDLP